MHRLYRTNLLILIFLVSAKVRMCNTSTTEQPNASTTTNFTLLPWTYPTLSLNLTIVILEPLTPSYAFSLHKVLPVMDMAIEHVNQLYDGIFHTAVVSAEGSCDRNIVGVAAARISCCHNITAFIGPEITHDGFQNLQACSRRLHEKDLVRNEQVDSFRKSRFNKFSCFCTPGCSKAVETISYMANDWNLLVITPIANTENVGDKLVFPRLTRINTVMQSSFVRTVFYLMRTYTWRNAVFFFDKDVTFSGLLGETFTKAFKATNYNWNSYQLSSISQNRRHFRGYLVDAATRGRVFILCMDNKVLYPFLLEAQSLGYATSGDYVFLIIASLATAPTEESTWRSGNDTDETVKEALAQALFMYIDDASVTLPPAFSQEVRDRAQKDYGFDFGLSQALLRSVSLQCAALCLGVIRTVLNPLIPLQEPSASLARYYDAVTMYATVVNETITEGGDPYDGLDLTQRIWNRTFAGITGKVTVNEDGDRNSDVTIMALNPSSHLFQKYAVFRIDTGTLTFYSSKSFPWPLNNGVPPRNEPECGFTGVLCTNSTNSLIIGVLSGIFAVAAVVGAIVALIIYRRWKKYGDKDLYWWKVEAADLTITDRKLVHSILSFTSKTSVYGSGFETESMGAKDGLLAVFKGQTIRMRTLPIKQPKLTKDTLLEFKTVRDLSHNNLVRIFGACLDDQIKTLLIEHCNKGSLQDLLGNTNVTLDAQFKFSLCMDIINGLCYLHESPAKCHGRLNSEVCLVDNRFSVKLADYALPSVYAQFLDDVGSQEYKTSCLWKAPEVLRGGDRKGNREADIYSFGIILCEVVTRDCPYSSEILYLTTEEILEKVRHLSEPPFRPAVDVPVRLTGMKMLMEKCWTENPKERPSAQTVKTAIKKIASSLGETGNLLDNLMRRMELYANNLEKLVEDKTVELREEKKKSEELLYQILPRPVADRLKAGLRMEPESYECVTIYFSDIVGFTTISARSSPIQVVDLLNDVYSCFDAVVEEFDVYKVETIGDAYMVVSGLPQRNGNLHAAHIARMSLQLLRGISEFKIRHMPDERMRLRIGLHSGPVCAGVVGHKMPRYCLFGDTVNTASRMESHGEAMMIHMSSSVKAILDQFGTFEMTSRGQIHIKGKGQMFTYWLKKENTAVTAT